MNTLVTITYSARAHTLGVAPARTAESMDLSHAAALVLSGLAEFLYPSVETAAALNAERNRRMAKRQQLQAAQ